VTRSVPGTDYRDIRRGLLAAYESAADRRDRLVKEPWKLAERDAFLTRLRRAARTAAGDRCRDGSGQPVELPGVLAAIARVLRPAGLLFVGVYGGSAAEGPADWDDHVPARFFSFRSDEQLLHFASQSFEIVDFHRVPTAGQHIFQSLTLRKRTSAGALAPGPGSVGGR
jgi:hypothetical protein